jgi:CTP:molybdopterin cytidylyltransferase MocA
VEAMEQDDDDGRVCFVELADMPWIHAYKVWAIKVGQFKQYCHGF